MANINTLKRYYDNKSFNFGISGDRKGKTLPLIENLTGKKILDIGCSTGFVSAILKHRGNTVVGIDISRKDISKAKKYLSAAFQMDIESQDRKSFKNTFDLVIMTELVEHLLNPDRAIEKAVSYLKPEGMILISTPNFVHLYNRARIFFGVFEYKDQTVINNSHLHFYTHSTLTQTLKDLDLVVVKENNVVFPRTLSFIWKHLPSLFAYQLIFLCRKR